MKMWEADLIRKEITCVECTRTTENSVFRMWEGMRGSSRGQAGESVGRPFLP
jgi:hypothetical protein